MTMFEAKEIMEQMGWHITNPEPQDQKFGKWVIKTFSEVTDDSLDGTFKSIETGIKELEKNINAIDEQCSKFMSARDHNYPKPQIKGNFPRHYPKAKATPPKKEEDPMFKEREKSDAGKLADKFTELLKKK